MWSWKVIPLSSYLFWVITFKEEIGEFIPSFSSFIAFELSSTMSRGGGSRVKLIMLPSAATKLAKSRLSTDVWVNRPPTCLIVVLTSDGHPSPHWSIWHNSLPPSTASTIHFDQFSVGCSRGFSLCLMLFLVSYFNQPSSTSNRLSNRRRALNIRTNAINGKPVNHVALIVLRNKFTM